MKFKIAAFIFFINLSLLFSQSIEQRQFQLAQSYEQRGDLDGASRIYLELTKNNINNESYLDSYIRIIKLQNKYQEYLDFMVERSKKSQTIKSQVYLGEAYWLKGFPEESNLAFKEAQNLAKVKEDYLLISQSLTSLKQYQKAIDVILLARKNLKDLYIYNDEASKLYILLNDRKNAITEIIQNMKETRNIGLAQGRLYALMLDDKSKAEIDYILYQKYLEEKSQPILYLYIWFLRTSENFQKALDFTIEMDNMMKSNFSEILRFANQCKNDGQYDIAVRAFTYILEEAKNNPNIPSAMYGLARTMEQRDLSSKNISKENYDRIYKIYTKIIQDFPNTLQQYDGYYRLAKIATKNEKNFSKSEEFLKKITKKFGLVQVYVDAQFDLYDICLKLNKLNDARGVLLEFIKSVPSNNSDNYQKYLDKANFLIAKSYYYSGKIDSSKAYISKIPIESASDIMNDILEFNSFIAKNENLNAALSAFAQAELLEVQEKFDNAILAFEDAAKYAKGSDLEEDANIQIAKIYSNSLQFEKSNNQYNYILDNFPKTINADFIYFQIGKNCIELNKLEEAEQSFTKIIVNFPKSIYYEDARKLIRVIREKTKQS